MSAHRREDVSPRARNEKGDGNPRLGWWGALPHEQTAQGAQQLLAEHPEPPHASRRDCRGDCRVPLLLLSSPSPKPHLPQGFGNLWSHLEWVNQDQSVPDSLQSSQCRLSLSEMPVQHSAQPSPATTYSCHPCGCPERQLSPLMSPEPSHITLWISPGALGTSSTSGRNFWHAGLYSHKKKETRSGSKQQELWAGNCILHGCW